MPDVNSDDLYTRLGISRSASTDEIKRAYRALVRRYTPEHAPEAFKRIREAYETLSNTALRRQYDSRPDHRVETLLDEASKAMESQQYQIAEQTYKKLLLASPGLHFVRDLLGICFLRQGRANDAIVQYERLLRELPGNPRMHANAGQAYWMAKRFDEAEIHFRIATSAGGERSFEYGLSLIQIIIDRGAPERADLRASVELDAATPGSVGALAYAAKRIELARILGRAHTIPSLLSRIEQSVSSEEQRRNGAFALAQMAGRLLAREAFLSAEQFALVAKTLQPQDPTYDALEVACGLLYRHDFEAIGRLLNTHVSFASGAKLEGLKSAIERYCQEHAALKGMIPTTAQPRFIRVIAILGITTFGHRDDDPQTGTYVVTQYFTLFFVPLFPIAAHRVRPAPSGGLLFLGRVPVSESHRVYGFLVSAAVVIWFLSRIVNHDSSNNYRSASTYNPPNLLPKVAAALRGLPSAPTRRALGIYDGQAVNTTYSPLRSGIRLTLYTWMGDGYLTVFPPLGGSGPLYLAARPDSICFATVSSSGDSIIWFGQRTFDGAAGEYRILGGQYRGQYGTWSLSRTSGTSIPSRLNPW